MTRNAGKTIEEKITVSARGARTGVNECASAGANSMESDLLSDGEAMPATRTVMAPWQARCLRAYIAVHLHSRIRVADLVRVLQFSPNRFGQVFRRSFDCTPHQYIMRERVARAKNLLLVSGDTLSEIATKCGFGNQSHLSNVFRKMMGESPGKWRRRTQHRRFSHLGFSGRADSKPPSHIHQVDEGGGVHLFHEYHRQRRRL
jgi:AraC-like DNA-binding protein